MRIPYEPTDRRTLFRSTFGQWMENAMERAEKRVVTKRYQRPPGALPEVGFLAACTRCGLCAEPCPPKAIRLATSEGGFAAGTPYIDSNIQPCTVCPDMPCVKACPTGALTLPSEGWTGYRLATLELIPERCVTFKGQTCRVCADCLPGREPQRSRWMRTAIRSSRPEGCVGCGVCVRACITSPSSFQLDSTGGLMADLPYRVEKPWGYELVWARTDRYVGKILHVKAGHVLSLQYHNLKDETMHVLKGELVLRTRPGATLESRPF